MLPVTALALAGDCWAYAARAGRQQIRQWVKRLLGRLGPALSTEVNHRFDAVHAAVRSVVADAVRTGNLAP